MIVWDKFLYGVWKPYLSVRYMTGIWIIFSLIICAIYCLAGLEEEKKEDEEIAKKLDEMSQRKKGLHIIELFKRSPSESLEQYVEIERKADCVREFGKGCITVAKISGVVCLILCAINGLIYAFKVALGTILPFAIIGEVILGINRLWERGITNKITKTINNLTPEGIVENLKHDVRRRKYAEPLQWLFIFLSLFFNILDMFQK